MDLEKMFNSLKEELSLQLEYKFYLCDISDKVMDTDFSLSIRSNLYDDDFNSNFIYNHLKDITDVMSIEQFKRNHKIGKVIGE